MKSQNLIATIILVLFGANILAWLVVFDLAKPKYLEVTFFDVGQGDAALIETPQRQQILIDGGPSSIILEKLGKEMPFWDRTIDLIILTHPEIDHLSGLLEVLKRYKIENILWTGVVREIPEYKEWQKLLEKEGANIFFVKTGQKISCTECRRQKWEMKILFPFQNLAGQRMERSSNDTSIVAKLSSGQIDILFTGDIEAKTEQELVGRGLDLKSEILKVAHHGSKTSTIPEFIAAVSPEIAVISVGKDNPYGHPHSQTLENLRGIKILRTDIDGDIKIKSDGEGYWQELW